MPGEAQSSQIVIRSMTLADISAVAAIDRVSFPTPWPKEAFLYELTQRPDSLCRVAEWVGPNERILVGTIVVWLVGDIAHIATLAIEPGFRRKGIGQALLALTLIESMARGAHRALLEVRESNVSAQRLYRKFGFREAGRKPDYYQDTHEDAVVMTLLPLARESLAELAGYG